MILPKKFLVIYIIKVMIRTHTWMALWPLWNERQAEQRAPFMQSKQYILLSLLWASAWSLHWTKKLVWRRGRSHGGHLISSLLSASSPPSAGPPPPYIFIYTKKIQMGIRYLNTRTQNTNKNRDKSREININKSNVMTLIY